MCIRDRYSSIVSLCRVTKIIIFERNSQFYPIFTAQTSSNEHQKPSTNPQFSTLGNGKHFSGDVAFCDFVDINDFPFCAFYGFISGKFSTLQDFFRMGFQAAPVWVER